MNGEGALPAIFIAAISAQCLVALRQGRALETAFTEMRKSGDVLVGTYRHFLRKGAYIIIGIEPDGAVREVRSLWGRTIFASFRVLPSCSGYHIEDLDFSIRAVQHAYEDALRRWQQTVKVRNSNLPS